MHDPLPIRAYPDPIYICDAPNQAIQSRRSRDRGKVFYACLGSMLVGFLVMFGGTYFTFLTWLGVALFGGGLLVAGLVAVTWSGRLQCSSCGNRLTKKQVPVENITEVFLVCEPCRRYVYTHSSVGD